jgi:hypothetical protein
LKYNTGDEISIAAKKLKALVRTLRGGNGVQRSDPGDRSAPANTVWDAIVDILAGIFDDSDVVTANQRVAAYKRNAERKAGCAT